MNSRDEDLAPATDWMIKSTILCLSIVSVWKFVIKNEIS